MNKIIYDDLYRYEGNRQFTRLLRYLFFTPGFRYVFFLENLKLLRTFSLKYCGNFCCGNACYELEFKYHQKLR